jgi:hypothetical protein
MQEHIDQLIKVFNTLLGISTKGEDTIVMGQCLSVMRESLMEIQKLASEETAAN